MGNSQTTDPRSRAERALPCTCDDIDGGDKTCPRVYMPDVEREIREAYEQGFREGHDDAWSAAERAERRRQQELSRE